MCHACVMPVLCTCYVYVMSSSCHAWAAEHSNARVGTDEGGEAGHAGLGRGTHREGGGDMHEACGTRRAAPGAPAGARGRRPVLQAGCPSAVAARAAAAHAPPAKLGTVRPIQCSRSRACCLARACRGTDRHAAYALERAACRNAAECAACRGASGRVACRGRRSRQARVVLPLDCGRLGQRHSRRRTRRRWGSSLCGSRGDRGGPRPLTADPHNRRLHCGHNFGAMVWKLPQQASQRRGLRRERTGW